MNRTLLILLFVAACSPSPGPATLVIVNGHIVTVDPDQPEAEALAIRADTLIAVGSATDMEGLIGPDTEVIDAAGRLVIPGFIEGHAHYMGVGRARMILDLTKAGSWNDIVEQVADAAAESEPGEWVVGRGWHQEKWSEVPRGAVDGVPTHETLSAVSPKNPVFLTHASGHASIANAEALRRGAVSAETPDPSGGEIVRDARGEPTGLLRERAAGLVGRALSADMANRTDEEIDAELRRMAALAAEESLSKGITSFHDAGVSFETVSFFRTLADEGLLPVRLYVMVRAGADDLDANMAANRIVGYGNNHLTVRSIKWSIDGALGPHGAWLLAPYSDKPESEGINTADPADIVRSAQLALANDLQLNVHAIGDRANQVVLDLFEKAFEDAGAPADRRWRIEHAQHLHPDDIPRFAALGVIPAMQGVHATSDGPWVIKKLGEQRSREGAYMWQTLWKSGAVIANGTDAPVEDVDAIASFYSTVTRKSADGSVFFPDERLTRAQTLQSYTLNNAYAAFEEDIKGSLTPGKLADITILSADIMTIPEEEIPSAKIDMTIVGGRILYQRPQ